MKKILILLLLLSHYCFSQKAKPFKTCSKKIAYTVDDWKLRKKVEMDIAIPFSNPKFSGGAEELIKYFKANSLPNSNIFRTLISFVVNCEGEVGSFQVLSDSKADKIVLDEQVLAIVKKMPRKWKPATTKDGKPVDSYQVLQLTIQNGKFTDVQYK